MRHKNYLAVVLIFYTCFALVHLLMETGIVKYGSSKERESDYEKYCVADQSDGGDIDNFMECLYYWGPKNEIQYVADLDEFTHVILIGLSEDSTTTKQSEFKEYYTRLNSDGDLRAFKHEEGKNFVDSDWSNNDDYFLIGYQGNLEDLNDLVLEIDDDQEEISIYNEGKDTKLLTCYISQSKWWETHRNNYWVAHYEDSYETVNGGEES